SLNKFTKSLRNNDAINVLLAKDLIHWHKNIFDNLSKKYSEISSSNLHLTINRFLNRMIFLRFCEENRLEKPKTLQKLLEKNNLYDQLIDIFRKADEKYNSGIFHFHEESGRVNISLDTISLTITISDQIVKEIINKFCSENSIYEFSVIPVKIFAKAYDIYLHHLPDDLNDSISEFDLEKSQDIRSEPGVINYIIKKTLGENIYGKKPGKRALNALRILDMSCGSGLLLLESYQYLLDWHLNQYLNLSTKTQNSRSTSPIYQDQNGAWQLTFKEKKRILLNNIFGVDINPIAAESASFILLLKLVENFSGKSDNKQLVLFRQHALPDLSQNIKCGNALIESDLYKLHQFVQVTEQKKLQINSFDWQKEFQSILSTGGFDIIIGRPPSEFSGDLSNRTKLYIKQHFNCLEGFNKPYLLFYEKAIKLLKANGSLGYVVPENWLAIPLNRVIVQDCWIKAVLNVKSLKKDKSSSEAIITIVKKQPAGETNLFNIENFDFENPQKAHTYKDMHFMNLNFFFGIYSQYMESEICKKIQSSSNPLITFAKTYSGYNPYEIGKGIAPEGGPHTSNTLNQKPYHAQKKLNENWKTEIIGRDISRYCLKFTGMRWVKYGQWLAAPRNPEIFKGDRILIHERISVLNGRIESSICRDEVYHSRDILTVIPVIDFPSIFYLLGIINSKLFNWYYLVSNSNDTNEVFPKILVSKLNDTPIRVLDQIKSKHKYINQEMISFVKRILDLNQKKLEVRTARDRMTIDQLIENIDKQIDDAVYSLYGLTKNEIQTIEDSTG
ncbi:Eco57I restriction-modification methylase domain-containing protein, partial [Calditrichota bacterium]